MMNLAAADAAINVWNDKYHYDFWRPWNAITRDDGNPNTDIDLGWTALLTAPYPEHPSGHLCLACSCAALTMLFGDNVHYGVTSWWKRENRNRRVADAEVSAAESVDLELTPGEPLSKIERNALRVALSRLKPIQRELLWWIDVHGMRPAELARAGLVDGVAENHVKVYVWRAREALRTAYERELERRS